MSKGNICWIIIAISVFLGGCFSLFFGSRCVYYNYTLCESEGSAIAMIISGIIFILVGFCCGLCNCLYCITNNSSRIPLLD
jgi:hypothetical protein